jgi:hypothetical protein
MDKINNDLGSDEFITSVSTLRNESPILAKYKYQWFNSFLTTDVRGKSNANDPADELVKLSLCSTN